MGTSAEEAIARAKAIAARLAGTAAVSSTTASSAAAPVPAPPGGYAAYSASTTASTAGAPGAAGGAGGTGAGGVVMVDAATAKAAEEALAMAFGPAPGSAAVPSTSAGADDPAGSAPGGAPGSTTKRKRWGADQEECTIKKAAVDSTATAADSAGVSGVSNITADLAQQALLAAMQLPASSSGAGSSSFSSTSAAGAGERIIRKLPIPTAQYPNYNFVGLLIGPGGSKQRDLVQKAGGSVKISVRGDKNAPGGGGGGAGGGAGSEEGLHVLLEGTKECVDKADEMISELLKNPAKADEEKARQLGGLKGALGSGGGGGVGGGQPAAGVDGQYGPSSAGGAGAASGVSGSGYTPKPVASILGLNSASGGHYGPTPGSTTIVEEKIGVPNGVVGYIIGRGGESIISMQRRSNCKVQIQKEFEMAPGSAQRVITLTADRRESVDMCRGIIEGMVKEKMVENGGGGLGGNKVGGPGLGMRQPGMDPQTAKLNQAIAEGHHLIRVQVPNGDVGLIIGRGGSQIKTIQDRSGANVQIPQAADADNPTVRTISVTHPNQGGAEFARQLIEDILKEKAERQAGLGGMGGGGGGGGGMGGGPPAAVGGISITVHIPDRDVGMCIGKSGSVIKAMQEKSGCRINIPAQPTPGLGYRICTVQGPPDKCQEVQGWIQRISAEQSSNFITAYGVPQLGVGGGQQYGGAQQYGGGQYQQQGRYGQQAAGAGAYGQQQGQQGGDQSAQWAAYYASQAAAGGGAAATAAAPAPTPAAAAPAPASGEQPAADAYYDAFFRYAAYYGEEAARKYYGAWSPPPGTPNPYGNATLQAAAAAAAGGAPAAAAAVPVAAPAPAPGGAAKDSSVRRGVSNLPAWMTNK